MKPWSTGERGIAWLGVGIALIIVAPVGFDGTWTAVAVVIGALALIYGGWLAWTGMRKGPSEESTPDDGTTDAPSATDDAAGEGSSDDERRG